MSKVFYLSLIAMMTTSLGAGLSAYQFYQILEKQTAKELLFDFWYLELSYIVCSLLVSGIFFIYRFYESILWPILTTAIQVAYFGYVWSSIFRFYQDPVAFIAANKAIWDQYNRLTKEQIYSQYKCKAFLTEELTVNDRTKYISCSRAIYRKIGSDLISQASNQLTMSFIHLASMIALWMTHLLGGIEFDQAPENIPEAMQHQYSQI